ncbi:MAG: MGMT family protein [Anaerolineae bacterium]
MELYDRIYDLVRQIPPGKVTTYGQLGIMCGISDSRLVGEAMNASSGIPWQRVINARGQVSIQGATGARQRALLEAEGILFQDNRIDLSQYGWVPDSNWLQAHGYKIPPAFPKPKKEQADEEGEQLSLF